MSNCIQLLFIVKKLSFKKKIWKLLQRVSNNCGFFWVVLGGMSSWRFLPIRSFSRTSHISTLVNSLIDSKLSLVGSKLHKVYGSLTLCNPHKFKHSCFHQSDIYIRHFESYCSIMCYLLKLKAIISEWRSLRLHFKNTLGMILTLWMSNIVGNAHFVAPCDISLLQILHTAINSLQCWQVWSSKS